MTTETVNRRTSALCAAMLAVAAGCGSGGKSGKNENTSTCCSGGSSSSSDGSTKRSDASTASGGSSNSGDASTASGASTSSGGGSTASGGSTSSSDGSAASGDSSCCLDGSDWIYSRCDGSAEEHIIIVSANHIEGDIDYSDPPPAGGDHNSCWATWGVHTDPVRAENWVHNLEHGGVVFLYNCPNGCDAERTALESFATGKSFVLVTPYSEMTQKFAVVAWGWRLVADCLDMDAFAAFYDAHVNQAPESISSDPPASCP